jgi:hypothetical protein
MSSSGTESDSSASSDVDFDDYGEFGYQFEPLSKIIIILFKIKIKTSSMNIDP